MLYISLGDPDRQTAHSPEKTRPLGNADSAASIKDVKGVRAFEHIVVRRDDLVTFQANFGFGFVEFIHLAQAFDIGQLKGVFAGFLFVGEVNVPVGALLIPL